MRIHDGVAPASVVSAEQSEVVFVGAGDPALPAFAQYTSACALPTAPGAHETSLGAALRAFFAEGGQRAHVLRIAAAAGTDAPSADDFLAADSGLPLLQSAPPFAFLALPGIDNHDVLRAAITLCERRRAHLVIDVPEGLATPSDIAGWLDAPRALPRSSFASAFTPWLRIADACAPRGERSIPPSGAVVGGLLAHEASYGVARPFAGTEATLRSVRGPVIAHDHDSIRGLGAIGVNVIRILPDAGTVVWGARTLAGADGLGSEFGLIPVRRLADFVAGHLQSSLAWARTAPNAPSSWARVVDDASAFLHRLWLDGALLGAHDADAYFVRCGVDSTMTDDDVAAGRVIVHVGLAAARPREFVRIALVLSRLTP